MTGKIFDIKKFAIHDGDGIRTTVFFKGCPLSCVWCHNPESISKKSEIEYIGGKCLDCATCVSVCKNGAHVIENGHHVYNRAACIACGECAEPCLGEALSLCGREMTVDEVFDVVTEDVAFYESSGGGVTLSGGECLLQADFCVGLLRKLKERGINCNVDTCGYVDKSAIDKVAPYTDVFLYDIKHIDSSLHKRYTGVPNERIIENLRYISSLGKDVEVRIPLIPNINDDDATLEKIASLLSEIETVKKVKILPYNNLAVSKYENIGKKNTMPDEVPQSCERLEEIAEILRKHNLNVTA